MSGTSGLAASGGMRSGCAVEGTIDDVHLLLASETDEVHGVAGDTDRKLWIFFRVIHGIEQRGFVENIDIEVITVSAEKCVHDSDEIGGLVLRCATKPLGDHGRRERNTVGGIAIRNFRD